MSAENTSARLTNTSSPYRRWRRIATAIVAARNASDTIAANAPTSNAAGVARLPIRQATNAAPTTSAARSSSRSCSRISPSADRRRTAIAAMPANIAGNTRNQPIPNGSPIDAAVASP